MPKPTSKPKVTEFVIVSEEKDSVQKLEWVRDMECSCCENSGSYIFGPAEASLCPACIRGLAKIAKKLK